MEDKIAKDTEPKNDKIKPHYESNIPLCPRCKLPLYISKHGCIFCNQVIEWGD